MPPPAVASLHSFFTCNMQNVRLALAQCGTRASPPSAAAQPICLALRLMTTSNVTRGDANVAAFCFVFCVLLSLVSTVVFQARLDVEHVKLERRSPARPAIFCFIFHLSFVFHLLLFYNLSCSIDLLFISPIMVYLFLSVAGNYGELEPAVLIRGLRNGIA